MIVLLSVIGALAAVAMAARRMWGRSEDSAPHDPDWGDWPPDQMAP